MSFFGFVKYGINKDTYDRGMCLNNSTCYLFHMYSGVK